MAIYFYLEAFFQNTGPGRTPKLSPTALLYIEENKLEFGETETTEKSKVEFWK